MTSKTSYLLILSSRISGVFLHSCLVYLVTFVTILPCSSPKQAGDNKIAALKRHARDFMGQQRSSDDDARSSYLESTDSYKYDMLAIARLILQ
jgi:hypothetical protein